MRWRRILKEANRSFTSHCFVALMTSFFVVMQSSVYQLFYDHIELNIILWFLLFLLFLDALFLWQPYKEKVPKRKISASDASNAAVNPKRFNVKTKNKKQRTDVSSSHCGHRLFRGGWEPIMTASKHMPSAINYLLLKSLTY